MGEAEAVSPGIIWAEDEEDKAGLTYGITCVLPPAYSHRSSDTMDEQDPAPAVTSERQDESRSERALRVSQLDADEMDNGLIHMLNAKLSRAFSVFGVSRPSLSLSLSPSSPRR